MPLSMYQVSAPTFVHAFKCLSGILDKGLAYADNRKIDPSIFVNARIAPDMFPLSRQIQIATDIAKGGVARLAGIEIPSYADTESTFSELQERIKKTVAFIEGIKASQIDGSEDRIITLKLRGQETSLKGMTYLLGFVIPNVYFHITTTYAILRHNGVDIGKADYIGNIL